MRPVVELALERIDAVEELVQQAMRLKVTGLISFGRLGDVGGEVILVGRNEV